MQKIIRKIIFTSIFLFPFIFISGSYYPAVFPKSLFLEGVALILGVLWMLDIFLNKKEITSPKNIVFISFFVYLLINILSTINSTVPGLSFWGSFDRGVGTVYLLCLFLFSFIVFSVFKTKEDWYKFFTVFFVSGIVFTIGNFLAEMGIDFSSKFKLNTISGFTIGNSSYAGIYLVFVFFASLGVLIASNQKYQKIIAGFGMASVVLSPIITGFIIPGGKIMGEARTSFFSILAGILLLVLYLIFKKIPNNLWKKIFVGFIILLVASGLFFTILRKPNPIRQIVAENAGPSRLVFWDIAIQGFKEKPILGWGSDTYHLVYAKYFNPVILTDGYSKEFWIDRSHNIFLDELVFSGILGFLSLVLLYGVVLFGFVKKAISENIKEGFFFASMFAGVSAFIIQGMMLFQTVIGWFVFSVFIGFWARFCYQNKDFYNSKKLDLSKYKILFSSVLVAVGILGLVYLVFKPYTFSHRLAFFPTMNMEDRIATYQKIDNAYLGNTTDLGGAFMLFFTNVQKAISSQNLTPENKKAIKGEMDAIVVLLDNGLKRENYLDMKLLMSQVGYYSILVSLVDEQEKKDYYDKGIFYLDKMAKASPENRINKIARAILDFSFKNNIASIDLPDFSSR